MEVKEIVRAHADDTHLYRTVNEEAICQLSLSSYDSSDLSHAVHTLTTDHSLVCLFTFQHLK